MIEKLIIGIAVTLLGALIFYIFRIRQLYLVIPRLFPVSLLTSNGRLVELRVYNKSKSTEEDVIISLDPALSYELVASTDTTPSLKASTVSIPRIPPGDDFSVLILVENGELNSDRISKISSKTTKGKVIDKIEELPPNYGNVLIWTFLFILLISTPIAGIELYQDYKKTEVLDSLKFLQEKGWIDIDSYARSDFKDNYSKGEFPIYQSDLSREGDRISVVFQLINKSAGELKVSVTVEPQYRDPKPWESDVFASEIVDPVSDKSFVIKQYWPKKKVKEKDGLLFSFTLTAQDGTFIHVKKQVEVSI